MMTDADLVRNTIAQFSQALDERRFRDWANLFLPDGRFGDRVGPDAIFKSISDGELAHNPDLIRKHAVVNVVVDVRGDTADAVSDLIMFDKKGDQPWFVAGLGKYNDRLEKTADGRWLFRQRTLTWVHRAPRW
jgi:hypothetical protein